MVGKGGADVEGAGPRAGTTQEDGNMPSGDFPAQPGESTQRWGLQAEDGPGGGAQTADGEINTDRFSEPARTDLELRWWNKRMVWEALGEPSGHEVLVLAGTVNVWRVDHIVAAVLVLFGFFGSVLFFGVPVWMSLGLAAVLALVLFLALSLEQRSARSLSGMESMYLLDRNVWEMMLKNCREKVLPLTKSGQEDLYEKGVSIKRAEYEKKYADPDTGKVGKLWANPDNGYRVEPVPKFADFARLDELKKIFIDPSERISNDEAAAKIGRIIDHEGTGYNALKKHYLKNPAKAESLGRGVRGCTCVACAVNSELGVVPKVSGAEAYREIVRLRNKKRKAMREIAASSTAQSSPGGLAKRVADKLNAPAEPEITEEGDELSPAARAARERVAKREAARRKALAQGLKRVNPEAAQDAAATEAPTAPIDTGTAAVAAAAEVAQGAEGGHVEQTAPVAPVGSGRADDDGEAGGADQSTGAARTRAARRRRRIPSGLVFGLTGLVVVALVAMTAVIVMSKRSSEPGPIVPDLPETTTSAMPSTSTPPSPVTPPAAGEVKGKAIEFDSTMPGDQKSGAATIAAYEHIYYKGGPGSAEAAMQLYAPGARSSTQTLQQAIDANPQGTTYRLKVTPTEPGVTYEVELTILWPGQAPFVDRQRFTMTYADGKFYILRAERV